MELRSLLLRDPKAACDLIARRYPLRLEHLAPGGVLSARQLCRNPGLPWDALLRKLEPPFRFDFDALSAAPWLPWSEDLVEVYLDHWDWHKLSGNPGLPWTTRFMRKWRRRIDFHELSDNRGLRWSSHLIDAFPDDWRWDVLAGNPGLHWDEALLGRYQARFVVPRSEAGWLERWDAWDEAPTQDPWARLSENRGVRWSIELLETFGDRLHWSALSRNPGLSWSEALIQRFADRWDWGSSGLSSNPGLPWSPELVARYADRWDWAWGLSANEGLSFEPALLERYADRWNWRYLCQNAAVRWDEALIAAHVDDLDLGEAGLSGRGQVVLSAALLDELGDQMDWSWGLSANPRLRWTPELLARYADRLDWSLLSANQGLPWSAELLTRFSARWDLHAMVPNGVAWAFALGHVVDDALVEELLAVRAG